MAKTSNLETRRPGAAAQGVEADLTLLNLDRAQRPSLTLFHDVESLAKSQLSLVSSKLTLREKVRDYEIELIRIALDQVEGNQRLAAQLLRLKESTLSRKIKRLGIPVNFS